jgi:hypothetical protein
MKSEFLMANKDPCFPEGTRGFQGLRFRVGTRTMVLVIP